MDNVIEINGVSWTVREANSDELRGKVSSDGLVLGVTLYDTDEIFIGDWLSDIQKRRTMRHELTHAFLFSYGYLGIVKFNVEMLCEFIGVYGGEIERLVQAVYP